MMSSPLVSIIIPLYNRASLIVETLESICAQTYTHWECIIVDDGSTDASLDVVSSFISRLEAKACAQGQFSVFSRPEVLVKGADACRNYGFLKSKGSWINWFDSDDLMLPNHLEKKVAQLQEDPTVDVVFCYNQSFMDTKGKRELGAVNSFQKQNLLRDLILRKQFVQTGCALWSRDYINTQFDTEAIFDESLSQSQDYDFYARILEYMPTMTIIPEPLFLFRRGNPSISTHFTTHTEKHLTSFLRARTKIIERYQGDTEIQKGVLNAILGSWNQQLHQQSKTAFKTYVRSLDDCKKWISPAFAKALTKKIQWAVGLRMLGRGAHRFRHKFRL